MPRARTIFGSHRAAREPHPTDTAAAAWLLHPHLVRTPGDVATALPTATLREVSSPASEPDLLAACLLQAWVPAQHSPQALHVVELSAER